MCGEFVALLVALSWRLLLTGAISHGYHLFLYPLYITDEGIYMQQAWSVLREGGCPLTPTIMTMRPPAGC
jgi:hypothetical protein